MSNFIKRYRIPTVIMRGGTSKGLILRTIDLPANDRLRDQVILRIYGSPDSSQIDGLGGGTSLTSKLALVSPASRIDADIDYTFGQVSINKSVIDYRATCGNMAAAVGLFAAEEGYVKLTEPLTRVRIYNTNTKRMIVAEIPVANGQIQYEGKYKIDGVPGTSPKIMLNFNDSGGTFTGNTLPTSNVIDTIFLSNGQEFHVTIVDSVNPVVFVRANEVGATGVELPNELNKNIHFLNLLEKIRIEAGIISGIIKKGDNITPTSHALPKIAMVTQPKDYSNTNSEYIQKENIDLTSRYISMGTLHRAYAVSGAIALATACQIPGTIPNQIVSSLGNVIRIGHPSGIIYTEASVQQKGDNWNALRAAVGRTARRIMDGYAYVPSTLFTPDQSNEVKKVNNFMPNAK